MGSFQLSTPVAFFIFNRPDTTERVFEVIRQARPSRLLVVADGPRPSHAGDQEKCAAARAIIDRIDWDCEVSKSFAQANMGCKHRMSSGLDWVFTTVKEAILLEDDCFPDPTFFRFCEELLDHYRHDERIMTISGDNFQFGRRRTDYSYYFSRYPHIWGWATWRRAWRHYDPDMQLWPERQKAGWLSGILDCQEAANHWARLFEQSFSGGADTWDYAWTFACWLQGGLTIIPNVNLVSNIGFGAAATHTTSRARFANIAVHPVSFPLQHPPSVSRWIEADRYTSRQQVGIKALLRSTWNRMGGKLFNEFAARLRQG